jgi:hypothetical protein
VHHRGQLTVYLRLLDVPLPVIYGPTADEAVVMSLTRREVLAQLAAIAAPPLGRWVRTD